MGIFRKKIQIEKSWNGSRNATTTGRDEKNVEKPSSSPQLLKSKRGGYTKRNFIRSSVANILKFCRKERSRFSQRFRKIPPIGRMRPKMLRFNCNHAEYHESFVDPPDWNVGGNCQTSGTWKFLIDRGGEGGRRPGKKDDLTSSDEIKHDRTL